MRNLFGLLTAVSLSASVIPASAQDVVTWREDVRGWYIGVDRTVGEGCYMYADFEGEAFLRVGFNPEKNNLQFIVGDADWRSIEPGKLYPMEVRFGSRSPWTGDGLGSEWGDGLMALVLDIPFEGDRAATFIQEVQQLQNVEVLYRGQSIANLSLKGTYAAMAEVIACQTAMVNRGGPGATDPFSGGAKSGPDPFQ